MTAASEKLLAQLHAKLTETMLKALDEDTVSPTTLSAISKFLKDNEITCQIDSDDRMSDLQKALQNKRRVSDIDFSDPTDLLLQ